MNSSNIKQIFYSHTIWKSSLFLFGVEDKYFLERVYHFVLDEPTDVPWQSHKYSNRTLFLPVSMNQDTLSPSWTCISSTVIFLSYSVSTPFHSTRLLKLIKFNYMVETI